MIIRVGVAVLLAWSLALVGCGDAKPGPSPASPSATAVGAAPAPTAAATAPSTLVAGVLPDASASPIPLPNVVQLSAPSRDVVWVLVAGQRLFSSGDRGATWLARGLPPAVTNAEVSFIDGQEGWLSGVGSPATQCQQQSFVLWHTTDSGMTWSALPANGIPAARCKSSLAFVDKVRGFVVASDPNHAPVVYRTADGGRTWAPSTPIPDPPGFATQAGGPSLQAGAVQAFGSTLLLPLRAPGQALYVTRSTDGGATWGFVAAIPKVDGGFAMVSAARWLLVGPAAQSQETADSGASWRPFTTDYTQASPVTPVVLFGDPDVGYATTRGAIQRTTDGGAHWTRIVTPGTG